MPANYLIRMDDACPTMDSQRWARLEGILDAHDIRPIVAVVPDNKDPELNIESPDPEFWNKVRNWQYKGWTIAMHGETHLMRPTDAQQILPFYKRSEFSGLSLTEQSEKLQRAQAVFEREKISVETWIAPAHCFDWITLDALKNCTTVKIISDSIATNVYFQNGFYWVPQQLWEFRDLPFGLWTICLHPNRMDDAALQNFEKNVQAFSGRILNFSNVELVKRNRGLFDRAANAFYWFRRHQYGAGLR
jgi:hypothetical protein